MRRMGARLGGDRCLTRAALLEMIENAESARMVTHQLMTVGRNVRSTPMQWAYEGKKLDTIVKYMSWRAPWVRGEDAGAVDYDLVGENRVVYDLVGRGRTPAFWWTLNCGWRGYNFVYDIHRLNVGAALGAAAVTNPEDVQRAVRQAFVRDRPDIVTYMVALRTELLMRVVMPSVVPHTAWEKCMAMGRCEWGGGTGNPHTHGLVYGAGNPVLSWEHEAALDEEGEAASGQEGADGDAGVLRLDVQSERSQVFDWLHRGHSEPLASMGLYH